MLGVGSHKEVLSFRQHPNRSSHLKTSTGKISTANKTSWQVPNFDGFSFNSTNEEHCQEVARSVQVNA